MSEARLPWRIEPAGDDASRRLATIHAEALPDDFLPSIGDDFLVNAYYPAALRSPYGVHLVAMAGQDIIGFVCVAHEAARFAHDVIGSRLGLVAAHACRAIIRRPSRLPVMFGMAWSVATSANDPLPGEIVFIAVDPAYQGRGVGPALVSAALAHLATRGLDACRTKTLATNQRTISMYERLGWRVRDRFRAIGRNYVTLVSPPQSVSETR